MTTEIQPPAAGTLVRPIERELPPVIPVAMVALGLAVTAGVIVSAGATMDASLGLPMALAVAALVVELAAIVMMVRIRPFAWPRFKLVFGWALVAYALQSALIIFAFVKNGVPSEPMTVLTIGLVVFATDVPLMIAYTVARYQQVAD